MTICPCCGFRFNGILTQGCAACGAVPVGEPLPRPEHELPSYARSLLIAALGLLMVAGLVTQTIIALMKRPVDLFDLWAWIGAAETAAWRLKWIAIPVTILVLWSSRKIYRSMLRTPTRFCGLRYARCGLTASVLVPLLIAVLIGVTIPERLQHRREGIEAGIMAMGYTYHRALSEYREKYAKLPGELNDLRVLPDPDGSINAALNNFRPEWFVTAYKPTADLAATQKPVTLRGAVIRNASLSTDPDETLAEGLIFTNYTLRLPGEDNLMGTEDDWIVRDGLVMPASQAVRRAANPAASPVTVNP